MPKMKTNKAAAKRFRISGSGRVRRPKCGANHFMGNKNSTRLRRLRKNDMVDGSFEKRILILFPYGRP
ncbi:MAG: 50S ribosomal protein L35 [Polyangiales bacterium]|jgi:large subunit ribosomal protein L35